MRTRQSMTLYSLNVKVCGTYSFSLRVGRFRFGFPLCAKYWAISFPTYYCSSCASLVAVRSCTTRKGGLHGSVKAF